VEFLLQRCWSCAATFYTLNEMSTHHLDTHERPLPVGHAGDGWEVSPRLARYVPPNYKAQVARDWAVTGQALNGTTPGQLGTRPTGTPPPEVP
jgi:hypothetical protein